jgi:uncharacterized protein
MPEKNGKTVADRDGGHAYVTPIGSVKIKLQKPTVLAGFPDNGMVGSICINHVIEQMEMHQVAFVDSEYIMASALYVGKKLRHPFRIYTNSTGTVCAILCEVPILARGVRSVVRALIGWLSGAGASEVTVLGSIAPSNISPSSLTPRSAFLLQNVDDNAVEKNGAARIPTTAFVVGIGGALLSSCVASGIKCRGMFVPSLGEVPDPGSAAILLEALAPIVPAASVDTGQLKAEAENIKRNLEDLLKMQQKVVQEYEKSEARPETERFYK